MRLVKGAAVYSSSGEKIGTLSRVVIDPRTRQVSHLVIEKGLLFASDKIVPIDRVALEEEKKIILPASEQNLEDFQDFEEEQYVNLDSSEYPEGEGEGQVETSYWYPPVNYAWWRTGTQMFSPPMPLYTIRATQNIPDGTVALEEGAKVVSADNKHVGNIEQLIVDAQDKRVTHFVISEGLLFKERKLIPVLWIASIGEYQVRLSVNARTLEQVPAYKKDR
ncbi:MAG: PRC-barrel domain-containing protein [Bacteroidota bacterium]|jgi:uncharacterized protein YrrD